MSKPTDVEVIEGVHLVDYMGDDKKKFKNLVKSLLKKGSIDKSTRKKMLSDENLALYAQAFTSDSVNLAKNYEIWEQLGDLSGNKFIVQYFYNRFPQLKCKEGVKVVARLRINYGSKNSFSQIAESLGFWDFISSTNDLRHRKKKSLLEDVFEAFIGVTEHIIDTIEDEIGAGYPSVYSILESIFNDMDISLKYEDLYDAKTRLKEMFDMFGDERLGRLVYREKERNVGDQLTVSTAFRVKDGRYIEIGKGSAALKADAQQAAAAAAIKALNRQGFVKRPPAIYHFFDTGENLEKEEVNIAKLERLPDGINGLYQTKGKSKHQGKYVSTMLAKYCRERNPHAIAAAIEAGADPNIKDSNGLTALDLLLLGGEKDPKLLWNTIRTFKRTHSKIYINPEVYDKVFLKYESLIPTKFDKLKKYVVRS